MSEKRDDPTNLAMQRQVQELLARLPRYALRAVIEEIDSAASPEGHKAAMVRGALVEHFNKLRPYKARRLFTGLFEPLLTDDLILYRSREPVPGLIQRVDMGGIWHALSRLAFPQLAAETQRILDEMSKDQILDKVLMTEPALMLRERMRTDAVAYFNSLGRNKAGLEQFLTMANEVAQNDARSRTTHLIEKLRIDTRMLAYLNDVLINNDRLIPVAERFRLKFAKAGGAQVDIEAQLQGIAGACNDLRYQIPELARDHLIYSLPPLISLNVLRRYDVALRYMREYGVEGTAGPMLDALVAHFAASCSAITDVFGTMFDAKEYGEAAALSFSKQVRSLLDESLDRFGRALHTMNSAGLFGNRRAMLTIKEYWNGTTKVLTSRVAAVAAERTAVAAMARNSPAMDHDDLLWLLSFLWRWSKIIDEVGYANADIMNLRHRIIDDVQFAFGKAIKFEDNDDLDARMAHFVRLNQILTCVETNLTPWISAVSHSMLRVVRHILAQNRPLIPDEILIIDRFIETVREELYRTRTWKSPDLVELVKLYDSQRSKQA